MILLRYLLLPFSLVYGAVIFLRNLLYDFGIFPVKEFKTGVISIGNLSVGGTGKTPMTEYLIRLLKDKFPVATLSRGYGRNTSGFLIAGKDATSFQIGDEPLQFKRKFPDTIISVDTNRKHGIKKLFSLHPELKAILMDDAFQHRRVKPGLSILLSDYGKIFYDDFLLPAGTLREWRSGKKRADIIVVTKCPDNLSPVEKRIFIKKINPDPHQHVLFSHVKYVRPTPALPIREGEHKMQVLHFGEDLGGASIILLTGISNPKPLEEYLKKKSNIIRSFNYPDHHEFSIVEANEVAEAFKTISAENKCIITTEKDAMRMDKPGLVEILGKLPVYYIPIETTFDEKEKEEFNQLITNYIFRTNTKNIDLQRK